jgi:acyl phosphate:glycerol-3-phosphate acyltransferase
VFVLVVWRTRFVSLGTLIAAAIASLLALLSAATGRLEWPSALAILGATAIIVYRHQDNIDRLRRGTERRFGERVAA